MTAGADDADASPDRDRADRVAVTGTPGTGKTTATALLEGEYDVIHLNDRIKSDDDLWTERDDERDTLVADLDAVREDLGGWSGVLDSHLAHRFAVDRVVVLRCHPETVESRLEARGETAETAAENAESEALDVILSEAVAEHGAENVYEVDATDRDPEAVADAIRAAIEGEREPSAGTVDFIDYI
ncbi:adenylate kinase [Halorubrum ezzemoulense]|uniref:Putative adenylate kinase n=1 Tax=Halorubrum ezzemoulense TaxID=337243 RepID=A0A238UR98_HALEZ|nr:MULTISPECIES: adenylate kinase family protein [Halorubrum]MDB9278690.1 adenylate kinase family protein [Halorubrum ezzemoulense]MDB9282110.1 adenylate kinase family protein [Halorubrum ezzemoulense]TKX39853.1 adenylate kinase [Halorubrum sp. CGM4_25_10-8A]TKX65161.1 adenylate kinase [Halorubrum sp. GN12_10-3_MGM]SNR24548.1 adenylate kinase [Halorubrum ezzemoulense]